MKSPDNQDEATDLLLAIADAGGVRPFARDIGRNESTVRRWITKAEQIVGLRRTKAPVERSLRPAIVFNNKTPRDHLVLPDRQARPGSTFEVDEAIGNYIEEHKPEVIIDIGDHADMPSLSAYDKGKKSFEGRRYKNDIEASLSAHKKQWGQVPSLAPGGDYDPLTIMIIGNHEERILRAVEDDAKLDGLLSIEDLKYHNWFKVVSPFLDPVIVDGVCYVHYAFKTLPKSPIGGKHQARAILDQYMMSTTVGHCPEFDYAETYRGDNQRIQCIVAGSRFDHWEEYAGMRNNRYWRGIIHKKNVMNGCYDFEKISLERLLDEYL